MADGYDRLDNDGSGGGSFVMGLLTGTVLGAGLGMLFAPKAGSELRGQLTEQAGNLANTASEQVRRASEAANDLADRGREMYDKARDAVSKGADEAQKYASKTADEAQKYVAKGAEEAQKYAREASNAVTNAPAMGGASDTSSSTYGSGPRRRS